MQHELAMGKKIHCRSIQYGGPIWPFEFWICSAVTGPLSFLIFQKNQTHELGFDYVNNIAGYIDRLEGIGCIIPFAENILPLVRK
jgi:hypothetical protein